jgi:hypothetical protein
MDISKSYNEDLLVNGLNVVIEELRDRGFDDFDIEMYLNELIKVVMFDL